MPSRDLPHAEERPTGASRSTHSGNAANLLIAADVWMTFEDFLRFCNITQPPHVERGLFT